MWVSSQVFLNGQDKTFQCIFDTVAIYLTVLEKEQHKKKNVCNTKNMQHFLQPRFLRNMLRKILAYRFSKLACGGGSVYIKAKYSAYYLNNVSKPGKKFFFF